MTSLAKIFVCVALSGVSAAMAQTTVQAQKYSATTDTFSVRISGNYGGSQCNSRPIQAQLYTVTGGVVNYQTDCYINPAWNTLDGVSIANINTGMCFLKQPRSSNPSNSTLLRLWNALPDANNPSNPLCSKYAGAAGILTTPAGYNDYFINTSVGTDRYYGYANGSMVTLDQTDYLVKVDKRSGATFEFYNKRAVFTENGVTTAFMSNAIYPDVGAALQIAIHDYSSTPFKATTCSGFAPPHVNDQGYWNPSQAGSYCTTASGYQGQGVQPKCTGGVCNTTVTTSGPNKIYVTNEFNMLNFDYDTVGTIYSGPIANPPKTNSDTPTALDNVRFSQTITAHPSYIEYDIAFKELGPVGGTRSKTTLEIPTFYFNPNFRKYTIRRATGLFTQTIPDRIKNTPLDTTTELGMDTAPWDMANQPAVKGYNHELINWVTFENIKGPTNDVYTIAWFYKPGLAAAIAATSTPYGGHSWAVSEGNIERTLKFVNLANVKITSQTLYQAKYVVFPYRFNEIPTGASQTVEQIISGIASSY